MRLTSSFHFFVRVTAPDIKVSLGEYDRCTFDVSSVNVSVESITVHPEFNPETDTYDLALIRLSRPIKFEKRISPICLPNPGQFRRISLWRSKDTLMNSSSTFKSSLPSPPRLSPGFQARLISARSGLWWVGPWARPRITLKITRADHGNWDFLYWDTTNASSRE